ncbi:extracellular catalytic domain type 1 short-chain-length polyhydroxyalkanoate depolymerase [Luteimonas saliphila]|uniref:extracellular catalytic domain type 1 short-chain-length polyhydroxyalkanoate depolymerase n=1 Tax=Luteimonas saliphila TaxID=2804919 RepID=UPI00192D21EB|nr:PHB depolymerase family esterase [Luteimonas saliphila]
MKPSNDTMRRAMRQMQAGDLHAATRTLQHAFGGHAAPAPPPARREDRSGDLGTSDATIEGEFRVIEAGLAPAASAATDADADAGAASAPRDASAAREDACATPSAGGARSRTASRSRMWPATATMSPGASAGVQRTFRPSHGGEGRTSDLPMHRFSSDAGELQYGLYVPPGLDPSGAPLLVMLHGCTQTPEDFARGTRMNQLAATHGYVVAWPAQAVQRNQNRCWNWFRGSDQQRGQGEPAMLAALTRHLVASHRLDPNRVYVAGLSARGAMAAVLASTHPDVYAAIGVHSGLPIGLASDVPSAFAAMRKGGTSRSRPPAAGGAPVPAIVFHGDSDTTVHPSNGQGVVEHSLGAGNGVAAIASTIERDTAPGGRRSTRTIHRTADGRIAAEHWIVHGSGHAWSGGDASGSYTDPQGPDASAQMLRFFDGCRRAGR